MQKYIIKQKIGSGSFGQVFLAYDKKNNDKLAVKRIKSHYENKQEVQSLVEVKILNKLKHPNVIDLKQVVYNKETQKGSLVFQYCMTDLLQKFCTNRKQRAPELQIKKCIYQIASALSFIHSKNYIHRDLKPENILLQENQFQGKVFNVAKLCDFGISKKSDELPLTQYIGTRWYRAPQLLIKTKNYTKAVDVFSLGCIMAEMYNLRILFHGKNSNEQLLLIMKTLGTPTKQSWPQFSNWCGLKGIIFGKYERSEDPIISKAKRQDLAQDLINKMLIMNPKNRISAAEILKHSYFNQIRPQMVSRQYAARPLKFVEQKKQPKQQVYQIKIDLIPQIPKQQQASSKESQQLNFNSQKKQQFRDYETKDNSVNNSKASIVIKKKEQSPPKRLEHKSNKKSQNYYSPYATSPQSKHPLAVNSVKKFDYFQTYVEGKKNEDRIRTTYNMHKQQESRNASYNNTALNTKK